MLKMIHIIVGGFQKGEGLLMLHKYRIGQQGFTFVVNIIAVLGMIIQQFKQTNKKYMLTKIQIIHKNGIGGFQKGTASLT
jgi:hypothetical protein